MKKSVVIKSVFLWIACANSPVPRYMKSYYSIDAGIGWNTLTNAPSQLLDAYDPIALRPNPGVSGTLFSADNQFVFYSPQWHTMQARNGRSGAVFQGGLSLMHIVKKSRIALGVYSSFGYSNARSSSFVQPAAGFWTGDALTTSSSTNDVVFPGQPKSFSPIISLPELKTTVMASTVIELGIKLGRVTSNEKVLPYIKTGWGLYRLTAQLNSVWTPPDNQYFDNSENTISGNVNIKQLAQGPSAPGAGVQYNSHIYTSTNNNLSFVDQSSIVSSKKAQWTNSIVVGVGFDYFPWSNISIGLVYQAAFCANVIFDQWNKTVAGGTFIVSQVGAPGKTDPTSSQSWYNVGTAMAKRPSIAMNPVFQSIILSCKYCWPCHK